MKIHTIFAQRKESYEGEYAPELLAAIDECGNDDNPDYMKGELKKANKLVASEEFEFVKFITFEINDKDFDEVFYHDKVLKAMVIKS